MDIFTFTYFALQRELLIKYSFSFSTEHRLFMESKWDDL